MQDVLYGFIWPRDHELIAFNVIYLVVEQADEQEAFARATIRSDSLSITWYKCILKSACKNVPLSPYTRKSCKPARKSDIWLFFLLLFIGQCSCCRNGAPFRPNSIGWQKSLCLRKLLAYDIVTFNRYRFRSLHNAYAFTFIYWWQRRRLIIPLLLMMIVHIDFGNNNNDSFCSFHRLFFKFCPLLNVLFWLNVSTSFLPTHFIAWTWSRFGSTKHTLSTDWQQTKCLSDFLNRVRYTM